MEAGSAGGCESQSFDRRRPDRDVFVASLRPGEHVQMSQHQQSSIWKQHTNSAKHSEVKKGIPSGCHPPRGGGGQFRLASTRPRSNSICAAKVRPATLANPRSTFVTSARFERNSKVEPAAALERKPITKTSLLQQSKQTSNDFEVPTAADEHICQLHNDILVQCLEKNGVYVCKSYGPRCFIIQKVK